MSGLKERTTKKSDLIHRVRVRSSAQPTQTVGSRVQVWNGTAAKTPGGLTLGKIALNKKTGRLVSVKKHRLGKTKGVKNISGSPYFGRIGGRARALAAARIAGNAGNAWSPYAQQQLQQQSQYAQQYAYTQPQFAPGVVPQYAAPRMAGGSAQTMYDLNDPRTQLPYHVDYLF